MGVRWDLTRSRDGLSMNDFLREYLNLTGTKFGCGVGVRAMDGHNCRCTGYVQYYAALRKVILADPSVVENMAAVVVRGCVE